MSELGSHLGSRAAEFVLPATVPGCPSLGLGWGTAWYPWLLTCLLGLEMVEICFVSWRNHSLLEFLEATFLLEFQKKRPRSKSGWERGRETKSGTDPLRLYNQPRENQKGEAVVRLLGYPWGSWEGGLGERWGDGCLYQIWVMFASLAQCWSPSRLLCWAVGGALRKVNNAVFLCTSLLLCCCIHSAYWLVSHVSSVGGGGAASSCLLLYLKHWQVLDMWPVNEPWMKDLLKEGALHTANCCFPT